MTAPPPSAAPEILAEFRTRNNAACLAAMEFEKTFYTNLKSNRIKLADLYHENAKIIWCGSVITGRTGILDFYSKLPEQEVQTCELDAQSYLPSTIPQLLVTVGGKARYKTAQKWNNFVDHFILVAEGTKWKILSHVSRIT